MAARFSIGVDLGHHQFGPRLRPTDRRCQPEVLAVPQWEGPATLVEAPTLPSFLYLPEDALAAELRGRVPGTAGWIVGRLARRRAAEMPGRVVRSAKSWLCHHSADRSAPILPCGSEDLAPEQKISPVCAAASILNYLRGAWNNRFARSVRVRCAGNHHHGACVVRRRRAALTLTAAEEAGFPGSVRLLEEPQAAFYCWLEQHTARPSHCWKDRIHRACSPRHVLVVDIGGGTSDFSLFELRPGTSGAIPDIRRIAVSEHILLGGDNIDLALAVLLETRLSGGRTRPRFPAPTGITWSRYVVI